MLVVVFFSVVHVVDVVVVEFLLLLLFGLLAHGLGLEVKFQIYEYKKDDWFDNWRDDSKLYIFNIDIYFHPQWWEFVQE